MPAFSFENIVDFLVPVNIYELSNDEGFRETQLGKHISVYDGNEPDLTSADLILVGCGEGRGNFTAKIDDESPNSVRAQFYGLFHWHKEVKVADIGNIKSGKTLHDTYAALTAILGELLPLGKKIVILGGSHDLLMAQYEAYSTAGKIINYTNVDAKLDMDTDSPAPADNFLLKLFTTEPNFINRYNHIGFQSYLVHPQMLETIDKLRFDCFRVGKVKENIQEMEPVIRDSNMFSFDISAIQHAHAPSNRLTPNGFNGEEACTLMQYAGMAPELLTIGIYGHRQENDEYELTAKQISHMLWYLMDGIQQGKDEASLSDRENYNEFHLFFAEMDATFLQSRRTGRWWMEIPEHQFIPCSKNDYDMAARNEIPERWMRAAERS